jgi:hypothetical protein
MILPLSAIWGGGVTDYRAGNAQRFDGVFDYDAPNLPSTGFFTAAGEFSILLDINPVLGATSWLLDYGRWGGAAVSNQRGLSIVLLATGEIAFRLRDEILQRTYFDTVETLNTGVPNIVIITKTAGMAAGDFTVYINGVESTKTSIISDATNDIDISSTPNSRIGARYNGSEFDGKMKQFEIIDRVATAGEIADASANFSFRGAGIAHNSGDYQLAIDFDKVTGQDPTTYTDTPAYTITGVGGTTFETYL